MSKQRSEGNRKLLKQVVCPHCWTAFEPADALFIAEAPNLFGDKVLGDNEHTRFLPTEFDADGFAIDPEGYACHEYACPHCHLPLPQSEFEAPTLFMSIVGAPSSGKSYYLASSTFALRKILPRDFHVNFTDADSHMNQRVREFEDRLFFSGENYVRLEKTDKSTGDLYNVVTIKGQQITYPQPFVFTAQPSSFHPNVNRAETVARTICLYDNSGESYLADRESDAASNPVTRHLAQSACIFFLFDPLQDPRFVKHCRQFSNDPQLAENEKNRASLKRQEVVLSEMVRRVRMYLRLRNSERYKNPFIVVLPKLDVWKRLLPDFNENTLISKRDYKGRECNFLNMYHIKKLSADIRRLLLDYTPEFIAAAEAFAENVVYLPMSASGMSPSLVRWDSGEERYIPLDAGDPLLGKCEHSQGFRSDSLDPIWAEIPMIYALAHTTSGLIPITNDPDPRPKPTPQPTPAPKNNGGISLEKWNERNY